MAEGPVATRPALRRLGTATLVLAALAIGAAFSSLDPTPETEQRPFISSGKAGETVHTRSFDAQVLGVRGSEAMGSDDGYLHESKGVWIIVKIRVTAKGKATRIYYAALLDGQDRTFTASGRITQLGLSGRELQPGIPVDMEIAFEVPTEVPLGLRLQLAVDLLDRRMDGMAEIELPTSRENLKEWRTGKDPLRLMRPVLSGASPSASPRSSAEPTITASPTVGSSS
jgi:Domain of unknown function (DUF4352)